jgi:hypothetical protein
MKRLLIGSLVLLAACHENEGPHEHYPCLHREQVDGVAFVDGKVGYVSSSICLIRDTVIVQRHKWYVSRESR